MYENFSAGIDRARAFFDRWHDRIIYGTDIGGRCILMGEEKPLDERENLRRPEIVRAAQQLAAKAAAGEIRPEDINEQMMSDAMYTAGQKDPDFILRPSGEKRLSNFMLWQAAYAELVEMDVLWPDFTREDLDAAITEFNKRSRRFGGI